MPLAKNVGRYTLLRGKFLALLVRPTFSAPLKRIVSLYFVKVTLFQRGADCSANHGENYLLQSTV
jgi:hypothetical protein